MPYDHDYVCMMKELSKSLRQKHGAACIRVVFFGISSTLIDAHTLPGQTKGLRVGCGGMSGGSKGGLCELFIILSNKSIRFCTTHKLLVLSSYRHNHDHKASYIILRYILYIIYL